MSLLIPLSSELVARLFGYTGFDLSRPHTGLSFQEGNRLSPILFLLSQAQKYGMFVLKPQYL